MRKQQHLFTQPFRKSYRHRPSPRLSQMRTSKKRKAIKAYRSQKTARLTGDARRKKGTIELVP